MSKIIVPRTTHVFVSLVLCTVSIVSLANTDSTTAMLEALESEWNQAHMKGATSGMLTVVAESCPTKIFLANPDMEPQVYRDAFGLNDTELCPTGPKSLLDPNGPRLFLGVFVNHSKEWRGRRDSNPRPLP